MRRYAAIVTGDRHATRREWGDVVRDVLEGALPALGNLTILHGDASGIDTIADVLINERWPMVPLLVYPAQWDVFRAAGNPNAAGPERNNRMLRHLIAFGDAGYDIRVLAFHNFIDNSRGTKNMVEQARRANVPVRIFTSRG